MRYLNKIVFINSAHIRYTEIKLDGNVHFIGTQGVGKSTILRAILFFYNADKMKLGIHPEQKDFDEFYLPSADSFIIYEVQRENGRFCVVVFRNQGRAAFRFIDSEYQKDYFVDTASGDVFYEWSKIRQRVGQHHISNLIRHYNTYRDIIYGNRQETPTELRRYSLMESNKYQNVPRTIQNIFLNQSLESRVVKDIIIDSMDFSDGGINLDFYRDKVKDFRQQYDDIWKWYRKDKNGKVKVRQDANKVEETYRLYHGTTDLVYELSGELVFAYQRDQTSLPQLQDENTTQAEALNRQKRLLGEEDEKHKTERDKLLRKDAVLKDKQDSIKKKRQHYQEIKIDHIIEMVNKEDVLKTQQHSLSNQIETITSKDRSVKEKYDTLEQQEKQKLAKLINKNYSNRNELQRVANEKKASLQTSYTKLREDKAEVYQQHRKLLTEKSDSAKESKRQAEVEQIKIQKSNPFEKEMAEHQKRVEGFHTSENELKLDIQKLQQQIDALTVEAKRQEEAVNANMQLKIKEKEIEIEQVRKNIERLQQLIDHQKGSLIDWLSENVEGWENTFGKVLDEESVLYNAELSPKKEDNSNSVFGVKINLENIDRKVRTPGDILKEKLSIEDEIRSIEKTINEFKQKSRFDIKQIDEKFGKQIRPLRLEKTNKESELQVLPQKITRETERLHDLEVKLNEWRIKELARINKNLTKAEQLINQLEKERENLDTEEKRETDRLRSQLEKQIKDVEKECALQLDNLNKELEKLNEDSKKQIENLHAQMDAELKGSGIDTSNLTSLREQLSGVEKILQFIDNNRQEYYNFQHDKDEYFDHEQEIKDSRTLLKQKLNDLEDKYAVRRKRYTDAITEMTQSLQELKAKIDSMSSAIAETRGFLESDTAPNGLQSILTIETVKALGDILKDLKEQIFRQQQLMNNFKIAVNAFRKNFSPQNTFHFNLEINTDDDYIRFATDLYEFTSNNKIEEYRSRISSVYIDIIRRISREVDDLMSHKGLIDGMIHDINKDFEENNFVGVIKLIELRSVASNDRLMQLLLNIRDFVREAQYNLGEVNLFSNQNSVKSTNTRAVGLLMTLMDQLDLDLKRDMLTLSDTFKLEFRIRENDNDTGFVEKLSNVGSDGTDVLVKAMINIMLLNVFKRKVSRKFGDFRLHCLMDEIGKLHPNNVKGILDFANKRNIFLINSSPTTYSAEAYRYTYALSKDQNSNTVVTALLAIN